MINFISYENHILYMVFKKGHKHSNKTKLKIGLALNKSIEFNCDYCENISHSPISHYKKKKRHFCNTKCYSMFRKEKLPKEEHHRYGSGVTLEEKSLRVKARRKLNYAVSSGKITREVCLKCGDEAEAHHEDYSKPLDVLWLCFKHHREHHKNKELLE